ncbi:MAG: MerR family DNA-binding transcriptional regulator [Candidatus Portnoybacteria bacterium CG10_big_fil_rev_8_21_14_0_10_38_18]|uniref:MerR family DNA-binding transcriptional regulator n=1 Tax=Candidatus Portnoybacteria bacterium CG10_big_fil_rev_8_21_14_0_10_38_18 TaxID=1974813 RepID=A0A2M8KCQ7_9BACT|nr:MAG: MerR family DNA-binding transcriptional regulator [Candidatus Portnoybacteria bacterium CG10_big_fil_rev_8_21_14_0_10_38_18]
MEKKYYTIKQAAKIIGVTPLTLRNWDKNGKLKAYRHPINNYRVYKPQQLELFLRKMDISREKKKRKKIDIYYI